MMKMLIKLDKEKIEHEGQYDFDKMNRIIDEEFASMGITKDENGLYINGDFGSFGSMIFALQKLDWFMDNISEWLWYDSGFIIDPTPDEYLIEDLAMYYRKKRIKNGVTEKLHSM
ncbi:MAG: hypothetical protein K2H52_18215 [Lachnospiraceae bacterium]|nr:hypothetical protein [Lachnospiraceae bacterium]